MLEVKINYKYFYKNVSCESEKKDSRKRDWVMHRELGARLSNESRVRSEIK